MTADFSACGGSPSTTVFCFTRASISHLMAMHCGESKSSQATDAFPALHFIQKRMVFVVHCKTYLIKSSFQTMDFWETFGKTKLQGAQVVALPLQWFFSLWGMKGKEQVFHLHKLQVIHAVGFIYGWKACIILYSDIYSNCISSSWCRWYSNFKAVFFHMGLCVNS